MPSSELSNSKKKSKNTKPESNSESIKQPVPFKIVLAVWVLRIICGSVFVFSGWAKAVDPWGTVFKLNDYNQALGAFLPHEMIVVGAFLLSALEFAIGVMVLIGAFKRLAPWMLTVFMIVMTPITVWIFFAEPVADCGCFGDALIISNGATLIKNVILLGASIALLRLSKKVKGIVKPAIQWIALVVSITYPLCLSLYGYIIQPLVDFRPFAVGQPISHVENSLQPRYIYSKGGEEVSFAVDSLPDDDSWTFVRREEPDKGNSHAEFVVIDNDGNDITADLMDESDNGMMLLCVSEPAAHGISRSHMANQLYKYLDYRDIPMIAVVASDNLSEWSYKVEAEYPVYFAEDTDIKTLVRGNAALVYVKNDTVQWKYSLYSIDPELVPSDDNNTDVNVIDTIRPVEKTNVLLYISGLYIIVIAVLIAISAVVTTTDKKEQSEGNSVNSDAVTQE